MTSGDDGRSREGADALVERLFRDAMGALELYTIYLGARLGLYEAMADGEPVTSTELASRTGTTERYVREWLEQQTANGLLEVEDASSGALERRYRLPPEHAPVLADRDDLRYQAHKGIDVVRGARGLPDLVEAFRTGGAPPPLAWEPEGRAESNRAKYRNLLGTVWLPAIAEVDRRLREDPPARVADIACGAGSSSVAMALAYPKIRVDGLDLDDDIVPVAREHAREAGVDDRVTFEVADASDPGFAHRYDLVTIFEALHDMSRPVEALRAAKRMLADGGSVVVADELVGDAFSARPSERERYAYGWSVISCLPAAMGDPETAATGTVMRTPTLRRYAEEAGFGEVDVLPIDDEDWRFYRLLP